MPKHSLLAYPYGALTVLEVFDMLRFHPLDALVQVEVFGHHDFLRSIKTTSNEALNISPVDKPLVLFTWRQP